MTNQKVMKISHNKNDVTLITENGTVATGTFIVGADGIYSTVRERMFDLGQQLQPGWFPPGEQDRVACYYRCSFGIAKDIPNYVLGEQNVVRARGYTIFAVSGPEDRVYWFFCQRLPTPLYGKNIRKYTKDDEAKFARDVSDFKITDTLTFGHLYENRLSSALTPLHEVVVEKWFFQRIICLGDSVHKVRCLLTKGSPLN